MESVSACSLLFIIFYGSFCFIMANNVHGKYETVGELDLTDVDAFEEFDSEFEEGDKLEDIDEDNDNVEIKDDFDEFNEHQNIVVSNAEQVTVDEEEDAEDVDEYETTDTEEFENVNITKSPKINKTSDTPVLSFINLSSHMEFRYYIEIVLFIGLVIFFINFFVAKYKNADLVMSWFNANSHILRENFALVGDDTTLNSEESNYIKKQSEHLYTLWCSGRMNCEGMLIELKCVKRQDLFSYGLSYLTRENLDQVHLKVSLSKDDMDTYVFCIANKRTASRLSKEMTDLLTFCPERKWGNKFGLPDNFIIMSEINEVRVAFLDNKTLAAFERFADYIDYVHISDRYSGPKPYEETASSLPSKSASSSSSTTASSSTANSGEKPMEHRRMMLVGFSMAHGSTLQEIENTVPILSLVFYWLDKIKRIRLCREAKMKAEKNRWRIEEAQLKNTHAARNKAAAARREEKRKKEKEKILEEDDPDKQRKWEEKEMKKQMKRMIPRMKQLKVKAL